MIDIEQRLFHEIVTEIEEKYAWGSSVRFLNDYIASSQVFPCVSIVERDNRTHTRSMDNGGERLATLDYEVNVYTNSMENRKTEARRILSAVDDAFLRRGFRRRIIEQIPNPEDWSVFRMLARYTANVDENHVIYKRP
ncbi:MAG: hypothetical protein IKQ87_11180 [Clostridia bacterium]|nr:hypothetical protein [Clostridia bacterium]